MVYFNRLGRAPSSLLTRALLTRARPKGDGTPRKPAVDSKARFVQSERASCCVFDEIDAIGRTKCPDDVVPGLETSRLTVEISARVNAI